MSAKLQNSSDLLSVSGLAEQLGVSASTVRNLEARGLVPLRQEQGYRLYLPSAVEKGRKLLKRRRRRRPKAD